jgi:hypothetical protein
MSNMTIFREMAARCVGLLNELIQGPPLAEIGIGALTELTGLGGATIANDFLDESDPWVPEGQSREE